MGKASQMWQFDNRSSRVQQREHECSPTAISKKQTKTSRESGSVRWMGAWPPPPLLERCFRTYSCKRQPKTLRELSRINNRDMSRHWIHGKPHEVSRKSSMNQKAKHMNRQNATMRAGNGAKVALTHSHVDSDMDIQTDVKRSIIR